MSNTKRHCDIGMVVALSEEMEQMLSRGESEAEWDPETQEYFHYFKLGLGDRAYDCAAILIGGMGPEKAAISCERLLSCHEPTTIVNIGLAGAIAGGVELCDVVVGSQIDGYHQDGRMSQTSDGTTVFSPSREVFQTSRAFTKHARNYRLAYPDQHRAWSELAASRWEDLLSADDKKTLARIGCNGEHIRIQVGHIASGPVVGAADQFAKWLLTLDRKYMALEMESYGVMQSAFDNVPHILVIRGVSDYCDARKEQHDRVGSGALRSIAMLNAVGFLDCLAESGLFDFATGAPNRKQWKVTLDATLENDDQILTLMSRIRELNLADMTIKIRSVEPGSMVLKLVSSSAARSRMQSLIQSRVLTKISGFPINGPKCYFDERSEPQIPRLQSLVRGFPEQAEPGVLSEQGRQYHQQGEFESARVILECAFYYENERGGPVSPLAVKILMNLAETLRDLGDLSEALRLLDVAVARQRHISDSVLDDPLTLRARSNRAELLIALSRPTRALVEASAVLGSQNSLLGANHEDTLRTQNNMGEALRLVGRTKEALRLHYSTLEARLRNASPRDSDVTVSAWNLLLCYDALGMREDVHALAKKLEWLEGAPNTTLTTDQRSVRTHFVEFWQRYQRGSN